MGFGSMFLGFMFLYDFEVALSGAGGAVPRAVVDIFPDPIGWILLFFGLWKMSKKYSDFIFLKQASVFLFAFSLLGVLKNTVLFSTFFTEKGIQNFAGESLDFVEHLFTLGFVWLLFQKTSVLCRKKGEDKLSSAHGMLPRIAMTEGILYVLGFALTKIPLSESVRPAVVILSRLDFLFWVFLIWFGVVSLIRALIRLSD